MSHLDIYTDGSCLGNPGYGGSAYLITNDKKEILISNSLESKSLTTNNEQELLAIASVLHLLDTDITNIDNMSLTHVNVYSDSKYAINCVTKWINTWRQSGWRTSKGEPIKNLSLIQSIDKVINQLPFEIFFIWVKGHSDNEYNNLVDKLAYEAALNRQQREQLNVAEKEQES